MGDSVIGGMTKQRRHYILFMVTLVYVVNYLDRQILAILLPLIKAEFGVSDSALGLLAGRLRGDLRNTRHSARVRRRSRQPAQHHRRFDGAL